ncbi:hypothetical protein [Mycobacteroides abscessus]|uniref:hypothetical protein n=1 Tax=Mycobacteroides abscessus TaxID=36809 RepID=UPI000C26014C|nr:hypothetical protein [Mycobacteroides abscessus]PVB19712.1 hypothetical protein DDJ40_08085 [Mycobacteroides abscessus]PVB24454.1 hypothetical protein DDJ71_06295 [Mycobacteroides abscessus]RIU40313.1 hypothetical protein D2E83_11095 [Mycobacteroides abscessus]
MTDPAVEAAQRAEDENTGRIPPFGWDDALDGAIQALKPIQDWFDRNYGMSSITDHLLDSLAPLIFTTEEINQ